MYSGHDRDNILIDLRAVLPTGTVGGCLPQPDSAGQAFEWNFGGPHSGGWLTVFCDGSVSFLPYSMEPLIHRRHGNRQDGNVIDVGEI